ncbi:digalactosyldiacylglycerol synthase [Ostreococcus tauri]|uniref:Digalactosyldiacylglycerol synthase n=1 Tax=Ostreococcus tauri TaxID=70448 RepID=A0A1Y5I2C1_OSTTA|nr:digalactosyldiacylglycerol synthase [Ostreococcus tauri]
MVATGATGGGDDGAGRRDGGTRASASASDGSSPFNMEQLRAAVDRHHKKVSSEVERAWRESSLGSFSFGRAPGRSSESGGGAGTRAGIRGTTMLERESGDEGDGSLAQRAGRKKRLSITEVTEKFTEMAKRASQDSLAKLDDARFMERFEKLRTSRDRGRRGASGTDDLREGGKARARSAQDLQAIIAKSISKAPSMPKWGEEWDVFKAIKPREEENQRQRSGRSSPGGMNRRRAQSETLVGAPKASPKSSADLSPPPSRSLSRPTSTDNLLAAGEGKSLSGAVDEDDTNPAKVFENIKREITSRLPRPPSLPKMNDLQNAVRRLAGKPEEIMVSSPYDASLSSPGVVLKSPTSTSATAAEMREREADAARQRGKDAPRSIKEHGRSVAIVTTASLPWMTGTAVNPLLRAAYLARRGTHDVTLVIPFLAPNEQKLVHPNMIFNTPEEQGAYVNKWVEERCGFKPQMKLSFYPGRYATDKYSIIPVGDLTSYIPSDRDSDVAVLEEPEHLNWYHAGQRWTDKFKHVVGIVHTNYLDYVRLEENGPIKEKALKFVNNVVSAVHCHKVIKLSDAVQEFPKSTTMNVHGVSPIFLDVGAQKALEATHANVDVVKGPLASVGRSATKKLGKSNKPVFTKGAYFLGKVVWGKGYKELLDRVSEHNGSENGRDCPLELDVFGNGDDFTEVKSTAEERHIPLRFHGRKDHAEKDIHDYKVFVNPSLSDVVATTTAEALAMGKFVVCAKHPSNEFFSTFPNCLVYDNPDEFSKCVKKALTSEPTPLSAQDSYRLSWEAATDRFLDAAELSPREINPTLGDKAKEKFAHAMHTTLTSVEPIRRATGAGANTLKAPEKLDHSWEPEPWDSSARDANRTKK